MDMGLFKHHSSWYFRGRDHSGHELKLRLSKTKRVADGMGRRIQDLIDCAASGIVPDTDLMRWFDGLPHDLRAKLIGRGIVNERAMIAGQSLPDLLDKWESGLLARGRPARYVKMKRKRASTIVDKIDVDKFQEIDAERVLECIDTWRKAGRVPGSQRKTDVSELTLAHYLQSVKQFTTWVYKSGYAPRDPLAILPVEKRKPRPGAKRGIAAQRRALTMDEQVLLVNGTKSLPVRYGVTGVDRAMLYHVAMQTGLRSIALRSMTVGDVSDTGWLMCERHTATKHTTPKRLNPSLHNAMVEWIGDRQADELLFRAPIHDEFASMLRADCDDLGIDTHGIDFHALRHTFGTAMASMGVHPKTLMSLMDHHDINTTMRLYAHSLPGDEVTAMESLPDLLQHRATNGATKQRKTL